MPTSTYNRRESRLRRQAAREGYRLRKLRDDRGYWLIDLSTGLIIGDQIARGVDIGYDLDVIDDWLNKSAD